MKPFAHLMIIRCTGNSIQSVPETQVLDVPSCCWVTQGQSMSQDLLI